MAAPVIGSTITVLVYRSAKEYTSRTDAVKMPTSIISLGPPGAVAWWGRVSPRYAPPLRSVAPGAGGLPKGHAAAVLRNPGR